MQPIRSFLAFHLINLYFLHIILIFNYYLKFDLLYLTIINLSLKSIN
jgi:hypothetical protein